MNIKTSREILDDEAFSYVTFNKRGQENHPFMNKQWIAVDDVLTFIKSYEGMLGDLPLELRTLKEKIS